MGQLGPRPFQLLPLGGDPGDAVVEGGQLGPLGEMGPAVTQLVTVEVEILQVEQLVELGAQCFPRLMVGGGAGWVVGAGRYRTGGR